MSDRTYAVQYWSASKSAFQSINEMPLPHLLNAEKKLAAIVAYYQEDVGGPDAIHQTQPQGNLGVLAALRAEIAAREAEVTDRHAEEAHAEMVQDSERDETT